VEFLTDETREAVSDSWESAASGNAADDLARVVETFAEQCIDVIAVDITTLDVAECGLHVARAVIPALQPLDADYLHRFLGGTRLYEVPFRMRYTKSPTTIESMNPYPHPYP